MNEEKIERAIEALYRSGLNDCEIDAPATIDPDQILLQSGLDSLGFAILVTKLDNELGYDPFTIMDEPVYPRTYSEFVKIYTDLSGHYDA